MTMAFPYDPQATNLALQSTGSQYRLPDFGQSQNKTPQPAPAPVAPPVQVPQAADTEVAGQIPAPAPSPGASTGDKVAAIMPEPKKEMDGMERMGALVGTVLSAYTGNYAGAVGGVQKLSNG